MSRIHTLPQEVITHIAAGQVADSPDSIIKELIENAVDAHATTINVEVKKGGLESIRIVDNGVGISKKGLLLAPLPHTTSKITTLEDLYSIHTFGFRGEALASIAAMGMLRLKSRSKNQNHGYEIVVHNGKVSDPIPCGMQPGTIVEVQNLYSHIPARRKSSAFGQKEHAHILSAIEHIALAYPEITFEITIDGKVQRIYAVESSRERVEQILGTFISGGLIPVAAEDKGIRIYGFIGSPQLAIKQKTRQYMYVNRRFIVHEGVSSYIKHLYGSLIDPRLNPAFIMFLELPADLVDVNIHPKKESTTFHTYNDIQHLIQVAISPKLQAAPHRYQFDIEPHMDKKTAFVLKDAVSKWSVKPEELRNNLFIQVDNTFLVTQTRNNLLIIDQHAAHERILYEQYLQQFDKKSTETRKLKQSIMISLPKSELALFDDYKADFSQLGFHLKVVDNELVVGGIPTLFANRDIGQLVSDVLHDMTLNQYDIDSMTNKTLSFIACKSAIKAGDELTAEESDRLLKKLFTTRSQYTCPHGRPVMIEIPLSQLHNAFRRK